MTIVCGDSHTSTHGAFGALAFGIGTSEVEHVLATQTLPQMRPKTMAVEVEGELARRRHGQGHRAGRSSAPSAPAAASATSSSTAGSAIRAPLDGGPDDGVQHVDRGRGPGRHGRARRRPPSPTSRAAPTRPPGEAWDDALADWRTPAPPTRAPTFDKEVVHRRGRPSRPHVTWGTNPAQVVPIDGVGPRPRRPRRRRRPRGGRAGAGLHGPARPARRCARSRSTPSSSGRAPTRGSRTSGPPPPCSRAAHVRPGLRALVVPGSHRVKAQAEAEGLDKVFVAAGFEWREPGCSMCLAMNPDKLAVGERCASTSNRNFEGRQGRGGRTHLVSPAVAAATAVAGHFATPEDLELMEARHRRHRTRRPARPLRRRHRPDHPVGLAEAGRADRLRRRALLGVARRPRLRAQPTRVRRGHHPRGRAQLRHRLVAGARRVGADRLRLRGRRLARASPTSSATTARSRACCPVQVERGARPRAARRGGRGPRRSRSPSTWPGARSRRRRPGWRGTFPLDEFTRERLLNGWDDIGLIAAPRGRHRRPTSAGGPPSCPPPDRPT